jgi:hypothetical protein
LLAIIICHPFRKLRKGGDLWGIRRVLMSSLGMLNMEQENQDLGKNLSEKSEENSRLKKIKIIETNQKVERGRI